MKKKLGFTVTCNSCGESKEFTNKFESYETDKETININGFQHVTIWCDNCKNKIDEV